MNEYVLATMKTQRRHEGWLRVNFVSLCLRGGAHHTGFLPQYFLICLRQLQKMPVRASCLLMSDWWRGWHSLPDYFANNLPRLPIGKGVYAFSTTSGPFSNSGSSHFLFCYFVSGFLLLAYSGSCPKQTQPHRTW